MDFFGSLWFVAKDVCEVLGIRTKSVRIILDVERLLFLLAGYLLG